MTRDQFRGCGKRKKWRVLLLLLFLSPIFSVVRYVANWKEEGKWGEGSRLRGRRRGKRDDQGNDQPQRAAQLDSGVFYGAH